MSDRSLHRLAGLAVIIFAFGLAAFGQGPKDQGIGGTGTIFRGDDQGLTGTGYFGTITDFGSVIMNGHEIAFGNQTEVAIDDKSATLSDLKRGQVIALRTVKKATGEETQTIDVLHMVIGRVDSFDAHAGRGTVLGQMVDFNSRIDYEPISKGAWIAVSGLRAPNGTIIASRIDRSAVGQFLVRGTNGQIRNAFAALQMKSRPLPRGTALELAGTVTDGVVEIERLRNAPLISYLGQAKQLVVEAYVPVPDKTRDMSAITVLGETFVVKASPAKTVAADHTRQVLNAVAREGRAIVMDMQPASFDDHKSRPSLDDPSEVKYRRGQGASSSTEGSEPDATSSSPDQEGGNGEGQGGHEGSHSGGEGGGGGKDGGGDGGEDGGEKD